MSGEPDHKDDLSTNVRPMTRLLAWMGRRATTLLAGGVFIGLVLPDLATVARPLLIPAVLGLLVAALLRLDAGAIAALARKPLQILPACVFVLLVSPVLGYLGAEAIGLDGGARTALVVWSASPPLVSVTAIALLVGLDGALTLGVMAFCGVLMPLTLPSIVLGLIGLDLQISALDLSLRLAAFLVLAGVLAWIIRTLSGRDLLERYSEAIDGGVVVIMLIFAVSVMDGVTAAALKDPGRVALLVGVAFGASLALQAIAVLAFLWGGRRLAGSVALTAGNRNMAIVLGAAPAAFEPEVFLYLALLQFPIYLLPAILKPIYRRMSL
jgi:BASS family bile acid:Na+ symporter